MTRVMSSDDMANVRNSLAQAGIYFDKLYINQVGPPNDILLSKHRD